jgi:hypothetical protein
VGLQEAPHLHDLKQNKLNSNKIKESEGEFEMVKSQSSEKYSQEKGCAICYKLS